MSSLPWRAAHLPGSAPPITCLVLLLRVPIKGDRNQPSCLRTLILFAPSHPAYWISHLDPYLLLQGNLVPIPM